MHAAIKPLQGMALLTFLDNFSIVYGDTMDLICHINNTLRNALWKCFDIWEQERTD